MKILLSGAGTAFFFNPWVKKIKEHKPDIKFSINGLSNPVTKTYSEEDASYYEKIYDFDDLNQFNTEGHFKNFFKGISVTNILNILIKIFLFNFKKAYLIAANNYLEKKRIEFIKKELKNFDLINIHYLNANYLRFLDYVTNQQLVLSFWGSDLMQTFEIKELELIQKGLNRANSITVQTENMKFLICAKFGWNLENKIVIAPFFENVELYNAIKVANKQDSKAYLSNKFNIPTNTKKWILCGYHPNPISRQLKVIKALSTLPIEIKSELMLITPMSYGLRNKEYINEVLAALKESGIEYFILKDYLELQEMAYLRKATDIFVHVPQSDALSGTMQENLYAGNLVITNANLPYRLFRKYELEYIEIDNMNEFVSTFITAYKRNRFTFPDNRVKMDKLIKNEFKVENWLNAFNINY